MCSVAETWKANSATAHVLLRSTGTDAPQALGDRQGKSLRVRPLRASTQLRSRRSVLSDVLTAVLGVYGGKPPPVAPTSHRSIDHRRLNRLLAMSDACAVPLVLKFCTEVIEAHGVIDGIYRLSGITSNIQRLRSVYVNLIIDNAR